MWRPIDSRKGEDDHCWMKINRCLLAPLDPGVMPSYWLFRVATDSLYITYNIVAWSTVWLEKTRLHRCFQRVHSVIGLTNSSYVIDRCWVYIVGGGKRYHLGLFTNIIPSSWYSYLSIGACHDNQQTFPHLIVPCTWHKCNRKPTPCHIRWVPTQSIKRVRLIMLHLGTLHN